MNACLLRGLPGCTMHNFESMKLAAAKTMGMEEIIGIQ